ncbi:MAG: PaeR7I family type II restriction endonuclease, partial [bacterium]
WDVVVVLRGRLLAALEFKSQVGSFGNNLNNRTEEAVGSAVDLWRAAHAQAYGPVGGTTGETADPRPPFVGFFVLVEDCEKVRAPVRADAPHFPVVPAFRGASYAERYRILCERLMEERLYTAASVLLSARSSDPAAPALRFLSAATSPEAFFTALAGSLLASVQAPG